MKREGVEHLTDYGGAPGWKIFGRE